MNRQIVIVGAGIAGLTAGYYLKQAGFNPLVLEKAGRVGGRMITDVVDGFTINCGAQFLMDSYPILTSLVARNGLGSNFVHTSQFSGTVKDGKIRKTLPGDPFSPLRSGLLSFPVWLRFLFRSLPLQSRTKSLPMNDYAAWAKDDDEDAEAWSNAYFGQEITDYLVEPIFDGLFFQSPREASKAFALSILSIFFYRKTKDLTTIKGGVAALPECLASQLDIRLNTPVISMSAGNTGVELGTENGLITADRVILATTAPVVNVLYHPSSLIERMLLETPYSSTVVIAIAMKDSFRLDPGIANIYGFMIPQKERDVICTIANDAANDIMHSADRNLFVVFLSGEAGRRMIDWNEEDILVSVLKEMEKYFAGVSKDIRFTKIYRWKDAMTLSPVGRSRNVARYRESLDPETRIYLAGDYAGMPFTEGAAETGKWAAETLIKNLS